MLFLALIAQDPAPQPQVTAIEQPTPAQLGSYFPERAWDRGVSGVGVVRCAIQEDGYLTDCIVIDEDPVGYGFGEASIQAVQHIRLSFPADAERPMSIIIPFPWNNPRG